MTDEKTKAEIASVERRNFVKLVGTGGFTAAAVAAAAGVLGSSEASAQTAREEARRKRAAKHIMTIGTAYVLTADRSYPIMQLDFKENIQNATNGKVYVKLAAGGQLGAGGALAQKVQGGTIQAAQHSLSNFAPFAPVVDLINLPYLCGANQRFVNLVNSDHWKKYGPSQGRGKGLQTALLCRDRSHGSLPIRKGGAGAVISPADLKGVKFRVPGSKMLQQYYRMVGANPTPVAWGETPSAIKQGVADALDPAVGALHVFGFKDILSHITFTQAVPDSQVYSCNLEWFNGLPGDVKQGIEFAAEITSQQNLAKVPAARNFAMAELRKSGVKFHSLSPAQLKVWQDAGGYQRSEWNSFKTGLAGSMDAFNKLVEAAGTMGRYYVHDA